MAGRVQKINNRVELDQNWRLIHDVNSRLAATPSISAPGTTARQLSYTRLLVQKIETFKERAEVVEYSDFFAASIYFYFDNGSKYAHYYFSKVLASSCSENTIFVLMAAQRYKYENGICPQLEIARLWIAGTQTNHKCF